MPSSNNPNTRESISSRLLIAYFVLISGSSITYRCADGKAFNRTSLQVENWVEKRDFIYDMDASKDTSHQDFGFSRKVVPSYWSSEYSKAKPVNITSTTSSDFSTVDTSSELFRKQSKTLFDNLQFEDDKNGNDENKKHENRNNKRYPMYTNPKDPRNYGTQKSFYDDPSPMGVSENREVIESYSENYLNQLSSENLAILGRIKTIDKENCRAKMFNQTVSLPGCEQRVIKNRFCYGRCNSFYVPLDGSQNQLRFKTCSACKPVKSQRIAVSLKCFTSPFAKRTVIVEKVKTCRCKAETFQYKNFPQIAKR